VAAVSVTSKDLMRRSGATGRGATELNALFALVKMGSKLALVLQSSFTGADALQASMRN
jgi:hypothetical protein